MPRIISIIIPVHNSIEYTKNALRDLFASIRNVDDPAWQFKVVVVDDGSEDGSSAWISQQYPEVHLCQGDGNLWWSGSINLGMRYAMDALDAAYILWWNNDIYPAEDYFLNLARLLENAGQDNVIGSKIYVASAPGLVWSYGGIFHPTWGHSYMPNSYMADSPRLTEPMEVDWLCGMGTLLPVGVVKAVGMLNDKDFPQYHGDIDYTSRVRISGFSLKVRPELRIWNHTEHSGISHEGKIGRLIPSLQRKNSIHNFRKEWLLYRKYSKNPLAYAMVIKKYFAYLLRFVLSRKEA
jgi:GT2 family glycosyltransferase